MYQPPTHIAIIMDGNGRWAKSRGLSRIRGHNAAVQSVRDSLAGCIEIGVKFLTLYAFSTENWKRPKTEVAALMHLLEKFLHDEIPELMEKNVKLQAIGRLSDLPESCQSALRLAIKTLQTNTGVILTLALSYGGRAEILDGVDRLLADVRAGVNLPANIDETTFHQYLYNPALPDPDLLIRTSGEMRISNFLLWQMSYAEIHVTPKLWPDFRKPDLFAAIEDYGTRHRRFGAV